MEAYHSYHNDEEGTSCSMDAELGADHPLPASTIRKSSIRKLAKQVPQLEGKKEDYRIMTRVHKDACSFHLTTLKMILK